MPRKPKQPQRRGKPITTKAVQDTENRPVRTLPDVKVKPEDDSDDACDDEGLTIKRKLFVEYITGEARGNATKAARMAGYASENQKSLEACAGRLLSFVTVQRAIARRLAARFGNPDEVRSSIAELADSTMANFLQVGEDGKPVFDWKAAAAAGAIGQVKEYNEDGIEVGGGNAVITKRKFKIHDRLRALELLAKMNGQLIERKDITSNGETLKGYAMVSPDDWDDSAADAKTDSDV